jgi:hypothetical protein
MSVMTHALSPGRPAIYATVADLANESIGSDRMVSALGKTRYDTE